MGVRAIRGRREQVEEVEVAEGVVVQKGEFPNLPTAIAELVKALKNFEGSKLRMAEILYEIETKKLYLEAPAKSMKAYFPVLQEETEKIGWGSVTTLKRYLAWYKLYVKALGLDPKQALNAVSHLFALKDLADLDRKTGELKEDVKPGKLSALPFEEIARLVAFLVNVPAPALRGRLLEGEGADHETVVEALDEAMLAKAAEVYKEVVGEDVVLPAGGWSLQDTQRIVNAVKAQAGTSEEGDDTTAVETVEACSRVWVGYATFDGAIHVEKLEFRRGEVVLDSIEVDKTYTTAQFAILHGNDAAELAGVDGEQGDDDHELVPALPGVDDEE